MTRRKNPLYSSNLDALMDTVTNVVGILIIILILVQVGVSQALNKIVSDLPVVSVEELQEVQNAAEAQAARHARLREEIEAQRRRGAAERNELAKLNAELTTLETAAERSPVPILEMTTLKGKILDHLRIHDELRKQTAALLAEQQQLKAALDTTPLRPPPAARIVRLPNSRPLPDAARLERYLATGSELFSFEPENAKKLVMQEFQNVRTRLEFQRNREPDGSTKVIYDQTKIVDYFAQRRLLLRGIELRIPPNRPGPRLALELVPQPGKGESIEAAAAFGSRFQSEMRRLKSGNGIAWFHVARDGFDTYLRARDFCEAIGVNAGWELMPAAIHAEPLTDFEVNRIVDPRPTNTPPPRPVVAGPTPVPKAPVAPPVRIDPPKRKLD